VKIEQLIVQYLYLNKQVTLQGIGTFRLDPSVVLPAGNEKEKDFIMPENAVQFEYNLKAGEDEGLVKYIVQHTRKILPLASSDMESYAMLAKQFLNIGKPLVIEGVGTVQKNQQGNYQFIPGVFITPKIDDIPKQVREKRDETISFESEARVNNSRRNLMIFIGVLVVLLVGLGTYYMLTNRKAADSEIVPLQAEAKKDTLIKKDTVPRVSDTTLKPADSPPVKTDSNTFKIVLRNYSTTETAQRALKRFSAFGHKVVLLSEDSTNYQLAIPFTRPLSDTLKVRDSLKKFFGGNPYVKL
jgi:hypothetical protein